MVEAEQLEEAHTDVVGATALTQNAPYRLNTLPKEVAPVPPNTQVSLFHAFCASLSAGSVAGSGCTCPRRLLGVASRGTVHCLKVSLRSYWHEHVRILCLIVHRPHRSLQFTRQSVNGLGMDDSSEDLKDAEKGAVRICTNTSASNVLKSTPAPCSASRSHGTKSLPWRHARGLVT